MDKIGLKYDAGKPKMGLIPPAALRALGAVLTYGANKYAPNSWQSVEKERYIDALMRHLVSYLEDSQGKDEESGLPHMWHLLRNAAFLVAMEFNVQE